MAASSWAARLSLTKRGRSEKVAAVVAGAGATVVAEAVVVAAAMVVAEAVVVAAAVADAADTAATGSSLFF
jgi:hypothetical protein